MLEITAPRIPCNTLAARMGDPGFVKRFLAAERPGLYCRVIRPGILQIGTQFNVTPYSGDPVSTLDISGADGSLILFAGATRERPDHTRGRG